MISPYPYDKPSYQPDELADQLAQRFENTSEVSDDAIETIQNSKKPLEQPIIFLVGSPSGTASSKGAAVGSQRGISIAKSACWVVADTLKDEVDSLVELTPPNRHINSIEMYTHGDVLENPGRLLSPVALAKAYQYGYWPTYFGVRNDGYVPSNQSIDAQSGHEFPHIVLNHITTESPIEKDTQLFDDREAVETFAQQVTDDVTSWEMFVPWYRTRTLPSYRVDTIARSINWSEFSVAPVDHPTIDDRFCSMTDPRLGDFIRVAILEQLEESLPSIVNISTGAGQWTTDRISILVEPTRRHHSGIDRTVFCPREVLVKLAKYGYRLIDAWYDASTKGYQQDDPIVPRKLVFARGDSLQEWGQRTLSNASLFDEVHHVSEFAPIGQELCWEDLIPCLRAQVLTHENLYYRTRQNQQS